jgi:hypothetical protein
MSLVKILILSNVLDPCVSLEALHDAYRTVDSIERERRAGDGREADDVPAADEDPRDAHTRGLLTAFWS